MKWKIEIFQGGLSMVFKKNLNSYLMRVLGEINQKILIFLQSL